MLDKKEQQYQALASWLNYRLEGWRTHREINYTAKWDEYYRLWRGIWESSDRTRTAERSRIIAPALQQAIESSVAELEEATFGRGKWFDIQDDMLDQDNSEAEYIRNLLQEDLEKTGVKDALAEVFLNGAIYGTGIGKIVVKQTIERAPSEEQIEGTMATTRTIVEYPSIDVHVEPISPKEFLIDPSANSINDALGVAHEVIKPRYHVVEGIRSGIYRDVPLDGDYDTVQFGYDPEIKQADESDSVKITEYWGKVPKRFLKPSKDKDEEGAMFGGPANTVKNGVPVPLSYGKILVGGTPINFGFGAWKLEPTNGFVFASDNPKAWDGEIYDAAGNVAVDYGSTVTGSGPAGVGGGPGDSNASGTPPNAAR
jgi:hypothetical protein